VSTRRQGIPFVVAAPSGTGKTTVCRRVVAEDPLVEFSVSHTTRGRREGEVDGVHYHFVTPEVFERLVGEGGFLEWAVYNDHRYGTSWRSIEEPLAGGRDVLLEIEVQGAAQVRKRRRDARFIFLLPPSMKALERRLRARGTDAPEQIERRLALAEREVGAVERFDYAVVNDDLERCVDEVAQILRAERSGETEALQRRLDPSAALSRLRGS
jgi:guanylate kinase